MSSKRNIDNEMQPDPGQGPPGWQPVSLVIQAIDGFTDYTGRIVSYLLGALVLTMVYEVVARYFFGSPTFWANDLSYMLYGSMFMLGAAYTLRHNGHIRTDFLYNQFSPRLQGVIDTIAYGLLFLPAISIFLWYGWENFHTSWRLDERAITSPWAPVLYPFRAILPVSAVLLILQGISETLKSIHAVLYGRWA